ncbi:unnamed protein product [Oreochromis niloticus]|nr:unnamed protein product [Mustela putorius furo]
MELPVVSLNSSNEPIIPVEIQGHEYSFMVDTGATYSCIGTEGAGLPLSTASVKTVGFSGKTQVIPLTQPVPMMVSGKSIVAPLLYSADTPINLMGRDILCPLKAKIMCTPDGLYVDFPQEEIHRMMPTQTEKEVERQMQPLVYWLQLTPEESMLKQEWTKWKIWVQTQMGEVEEVRLPLHCTLLFDGNHRFKDYEACWDELLNKKPFLITSEDIYIGPQGAAAAVTLPDELKDWFQVQNSVPHITLLIAQGHESHELGPMIKQALQVPEWEPTENKLIHLSKDRQFVRISMKNSDESVATKVMLNERPVSLMPLSAEHEHLLKQVPAQLWSITKTDVGKVKSAQPVKVKLKPEIKLPYIKQYPLKPHAIEGIKPIIEGLEKAGVLIKATSPCNTPICPIQKPNSKDYRLVHDLRAINAIVESETHVVPDPHTLLSNIPPDTRWYTVIDLCSAFFSIPLHSDSQYLFAFTYQNQQYVYTRLPQGFTQSPSIFNRVLAQDLQHLSVPSVVLQYADDLLICSPTKEQCERDSIAVLSVLAEGGHKVSKDKIQFCQQSVEYLGRQLRGEKKLIAPSQIEAVVKAPKPQTVGQMLSFLGMAGYSRPWICDYAFKTAPLRALIRAAGQNNCKSELQWTEEASAAFEALKGDMQSAPALGNPDYSKPFHLYVANRGSYANAVLMQDTPIGKQPLAYYSTKLDNIEAGLPPCYQGLAAAAFAFQKVASLTMGHPVILYTSHQLHALLSSPRFVITQARRTGYEVILSAPELTIQRCNTVNPASRMMLPDEGIPHDCLQQTDKFMRAREDLFNEPITADLTLFVDGSCFRDEKGCHAGYGIVQLNPANSGFTTLQTQKVDQPCSAQLAELKALTAACKLAAGKRLNVYTDSAYAYGVCHVSANIWKQRGFQRADGTPVIHGEAVAQLIEALQLPSAVAVIKCPAHQKTDTLIAKGNNLADEAAKQAATGDKMAPLLLQESQEAPLVTLQSLIEAQSKVDPQEKRLWERRGAIRSTSPPHEGLWRSVQGQFVMPSSILPIAVRKAHGVDHCHRREVIKRLQEVWWSPLLIAEVNRILNECEICAKNNVRKSFSAPLAHIPPPDGPFRHLVIDFIDMGMENRREGMRYVLVVVCRFSRWVEATPTRAPDHKSVAKFLSREVFPRFGLPDTISSDNGPHFVSQVIQVMLKMLGIKQKFGCVYHPQSQGSVERQNGIIKAKITKIIADVVKGSGEKLSWLQALPLALMCMRSQTNRTMCLSPHELLTGRPMPLPYYRGPYEGPSLEQLENEMGSYLRQLTRIHKVIFQQVKGATADRDAEIPDHLLTIRPGDQVYLKVIKRRWDQPRREGPYTVILATPTAVKVADKHF